MRWKRVAGSGDIEDRRGEAGQSSGGLPFPFRSAGQVAAA